MPSFFFFFRIILISILIIPFILIVVCIGPGEELWEVINDASILIRLFFISLFFFLVILPLHVFLFSHLC